MFVELAIKPSLESKLIPSYMRRQPVAGGAAAVASTSTAGELGSVSSN